MTESWTCRACGWTNKGGRFCFECGRDGDPDQIAQQRFVAEPQEDDPPWRRAAIIAGAIVLLAAVVAGIAILLSGGDSPTTTAPAPQPPPVASNKLDRAQTVDELMKIVVASGAGLAATRKGEWARAAENRKRLVRRLELLATRTREIEAARTALKSALQASERADVKSLTCGDKGGVSACAAPTHQRAGKLKERFRRTFNKILEADGKAPVAANSF